MHIMLKTNYEIRYHRKYIIIMPKHRVPRLTGIFMTSGLQSRYYVNIAYFNDFEQELVVYVSNSLTYN